MLLRRRSRCEVVEPGKCIWKRGMKEKVTNA